MFITPSKTFNLIILLLSFVLEVLALPQPLTTRSNSDLSLTAQLRLADTAIERYNLLPNDTSFIFDFTTNTDLPVATSQNWPVLVNVGAAFSISQLPACSMTFLHLHPRATELFALTSGHIISSMIPETGVLNANNTQRVITNDLYPGQVTIYPAGSFHTQVNPDCEAANFTATFTSDEFAVGLVAEQLFEFDDGVVGRTFGGKIDKEEVERLRGLIPEDMALRVEECLGRCGGAEK
ncbi:RmlC-like cupin [Aspergillus sclerotioniger CBS 115572]|uniref:RmlC-like cupin n=1 Tax=Aspergillus sclerotioniger CBS 115572 TaxID=1450535 RepID=A0A317XE64_9EURO|nr:RmlC-like cupin [Aspergillus sclerotioniger CBS 115572]PWY95917.1 RmlC-like cupin [Aspergillus sclerotioniger CBS 115572]